MWGSAARRVALTRPDAGPPWTATKWLGAVSRRRRRARRVLVRGTEQSSPAESIRSTRKRPYTGAAPLCFRSRNSSNSGRRSSPRRTASSCCSSCRSRTSSRRLFRAATAASFNLLRRPEAPFARERLKVAAVLRGELGFDNDIWSCAHTTKSWWSTFKEFRAISFGRHPVHRVYCFPDASEDQAPCTLVPRLRDCSRHGGLENPQRVGEPTARPARPVDSATVSRTGGGRGWRFRSG